MNRKSETNNSEIDKTKNIDTVMPIYNLIEYSDSYSRHLEVYGNITKMSQMIAADDGNRKYIEIQVPLKYLSNFGELL